MATRSKLFRLCSILMSCIFAYSAFVQLNDPDWYFWFPLYAFACTVNLKNLGTRFAATVALWLGSLLFIKVVIEDFASGIAGLCSLDLRERLVREKIGSGLVVISMILHLEAASVPRHHHRQPKNKKFSKFVDIGMTVLVGFSYGLPFIFFVVQKGDIKF